MNPFKNISVFRDQDIYSTCSLRPWSYENAGSQWPLQRDTETTTTPFPEKEEQLQQENDRLQHLTTVLIDHIWKTEDHGFPLKEIDERMLEYDKKQPQHDDGGIDGTPRNVTK